MSEKKPSKSVMGNLPSTRPTRMGRRRDGEPASGATAEPAAQPPPKAKPAAKRRAAAPKPTAARPEGAAKRKPKPTAARPEGAAKPKATAAKSGRAGKPRAAGTPRAVRSGSPALKPPTADRDAPRAAPATPPKGAELVTTAVQAAGELAQIGLTLGGQMVKRAVDKLPKP